MAGPAMRAAQAIPPEIGGLLDGAPFGGPSEALPLVTAETGALAAQLQQNDKAEIAAPEHFGRPRARLMMKLVAGVVSGTNIYGGYKNQPSRQTTYMYLYC